MCGNAESQSQKAVTSVGREGKGTNKSYKCISTKLGFMEICKKYGKMLTFGKVYFSVYFT